MLLGSFGRPCRHQISQQLLQLLQKSFKDLLLNIINSMWHLALGRAGRYQIPKQLLQLLQRKF